MRPVLKWVPGDPGNPPPPIHATYNPYQSAKDDMERNHGPFCSFCERRVEDDALHVEHIQPKGLAQYEHLKFSWNNFLLACQRCNGADNKNAHDVVYGQVHLPNKNNTLISMVYLTGGLIKVNPVLRGASLRNAVKLIKLIGLQKRPGHRKHLPKDKRWMRRKKVWDLANDKLNDFEAGEIGSNIIVELALGYGYFSLWYTVFQNHPAVKQILINAFPGTDLDSFNALNGYTPQNRNIPNLSDPI